jgi:hypothetical protein
MLRYMTALRPCKTLLNDLMHEVFFLNKLSFCLIIFLVNISCVEGATKDKSHPSRHVDKSLNLEDKDEWAFTNEFNVYRNASYLNTAIEFSGKNGWDFQFSSNNLPLYDNGGNFTYDTYVNVSKTITFKSKTRWTIGAQAGTTLFTPRQLHSFVYMITTQELIPGVDTRSGSFFANKQLTGTTNVFGWMFGFTWTIKPNIILTGDYYSGNNSVSGGTVNLAYKFKSGFTGTIGVGIPETNSGNEFYGITGVQYTW